MVKKNSSNMKRGVLVSYFLAILLLNFMLVRIYNQHRILSLTVATQEAKIESLTLENNKIVSVMVQMNEKHSTVISAYADIVIGLNAKLRALDSLSETSYYALEQKALSIKKKEAANSIIGDLGLKKEDKKKKDKTPPAKTYKIVTPNSKELAKIDKDLNELQKIIGLPIQKEVPDNEEYKKIIARAKRYKTDTSYVTNNFIQFVYDEAKSKNIDPLVVFAIIDVESNFNKSVTNKYASVIGLGQITTFTGKFIHTSLLKRKTEYVHTDLKDPRINAKFIIAYLVYLKNKHKSYDGAIKEYCGGFMKGHETFYPTRHRPKIVNALVAYGMTKEKAESVLSTKIPPIKK